MANYYSRMDLSCDFIESVIVGNYDEMGFLVLENSTEVASSGNFFTSAASSYNQFTRQVTPLQIFGLCASILACAIFGMWALVLTRNVSPPKFWRHQRTGARGNVPASGPITRQNSGIVLGRSATLEQGTAPYHAAS